MGVGDQSAEGGGCSNGLAVPAYAAVPLVPFVVPLVPLCSTPSALRGTPSTLCSTPSTLRSTPTVPA